MSVAVTQAKCRFGTESASGIIAGLRGRRGLFAAAWAWYTPACPSASSSADRALPCGGRGRGFESLLAYQSGCCFQAPPLDIGGAFVSAVRPSVVGPGGAR